MKLGTKIALAALLLAVLAAAAAPLYLDALAAAAVERGASYALGVKTEVESVDVGVFSGRASVADLRIANPEGFGGERFLTLGEGSVDVSLGTLLEDVVEIPALMLSDLRVNLERRSGRANYEVILANLAGREGGASPAGREGKRYVIGTLTLRDVTVRADLLPVDGNLTQVDLPIREIRLTNIGSDSDRGVLLWELTGIVVKAVVRAAIEQGGGVLPSVVVDGLEAGLGGLESLGEMGIEFRVELGEALGDAVEGAAKGVQKAIEGLGDVLDGSEPKPKPDAREGGGGDS
jgi:hypothetical protein